VSVRHLLVTGTSRGIGRATALRLTLAGMSVLAGVRNSDDGEALEREAAGAGHEPRSRHQPGGHSIKRAAEILRATVGGDGLFALVNNAAGGGRGSPMAEVTRAALEGAFGVTAFGTVLTTRALLPIIWQARGRIVNVGAGRLPLPFLGPGFGARSASATA
jgi:11-cis-retinol dehydrogenase